MRARKIPQTDSIHELARFWDTHDLTDFEDQLEEVTDVVFERQAVVKVPLSREAVAVVKKMAKSKGIRYTELIRDWILEKVHAT